MKPKNINQTTKVCKTCQKRKSLKTTKFHGHLCIDCWREYQKLRARDKYNNRFKLIDEAVMNDPNPTPLLTPDEIEFRAKLIKRILNILEKHYGRYGHTQELVAASIVGANETLKEVLQSIPWVSRVK